MFYNPLNLQILVLPFPCLVCRWVAGITWMMCFRCSYWKKVALMNGVSGRLNAIFEHQRLSRGRWDYGTRSPSSHSIRASHVPCVDMLIYQTFPDLHHHPGCVETLEIDISSANSGNSSYEGVLSTNRTNWTRGLLTRWACYNPICFRFVTKKCCPCERLWRSHILFQASLWVKVWPFGEITRRTQGLWISDGSVRKRQRCMAEIWGQHSGAERRDHDGQPHKGLGNDHSTHSAQIVLAMYQQTKV